MTAFDVNLKTWREYLARVFSTPEKLMLVDRAESAWIFGEVARLRLPVDVAFEKKHGRLFIYEPLASTCKDAIKRHEIACDNGDGCDVWERLPDIVLYDANIKVERLHNLLRLTPYPQPARPARERIYSQQEPLPLC